MIYLSALETIVIIVSMMITNGSAVLVGQGYPIDLGRKFIDGKRILGDGKSFEGALIALLYGSAILILLSNIFSVTHVIPIGIIALLGALLGDIVASFVKRRLGLERGSPLPIVDQLDFYIGGILLLLAIGVIMDVVVIIVFTPIVFIMHRLTNIIAYRLGLKDVPW